jgi:hypothetical protein
VALCREHLTESDLSALAELVEPGSGRAVNPFVRAWRDKETQLRNAVAKLRAERLQRDASPYLHEHEGQDTRVEKAASEAFGGKTPMDRELALDRFRWNQIEETAGFNPFATEAMLAYALKLRLAERWAGLDAERAAAKVEEILARGPRGTEEKKPPDAESDNPTQRVTVDSPGMNHG